MQDVQPKLKELRIMLGLSQYEIADKLGIKQPAWARYESGRSGMTLPMLVHICKTFDVDANWLLGIKE